MNEKITFLNPVKNRFLPLPRNATEGLEHEPSIKDFNIIKQIGIGSFGQVHLVSHKKTKAQYAIKSINKHLPENIEEKANFNREVEIMYKLNHPNIVKLYGHFEDDDFCYFLMQYIPKRSVLDIITLPGQKPNLKLIASVMKDLLSAVYYLHNMKPVIMHRDIKPENILLDDNNIAYLTDFGWSNYIGKFRRRNTVCGTPLYLPPEMVEEFGHDETADIWCIGVLLFELITGSCPFAGNDFETVKYNISMLNISWPSSLDPDAKDLISKILKLKGKDRLSIEKILNHKFFVKYFPNAEKELIKPEGQINKIFIISADNPKTWGQQNKLTSNPISNNISNKTNSISNSNNRINIKNDTAQNYFSNIDHKYKKIKVVNQKKREENYPTNSELYVPRANIDLSKAIKKEKDIKKQTKIKCNINQNSSFSKYRVNNISHKMIHHNTASNIKSSNSPPHAHRFSYKTIPSNNFSEKSYSSNRNNIYRNSYKSIPNAKLPNINGDNKVKLRNSYKSFKPNQNNAKTNYNIGVANIKKKGNKININSSFINKNDINEIRSNYRKSYRPENKNNCYNSNYNNKK